MISLTERLLGEFCETVTKTMGKNVETVHTINTGEHQPIRSHPNRTAGMEGPTTRAGR